MPNSQLVEALNQALSWELRAIAMYAHYSAYVSGIHRLHLSAHFSNEVNESVMHAATVRSAIVKLDGTAITERDPSPIVHTSNIGKYSKRRTKQKRQPQKLIVEFYR